MFILRLDRVEAVCSKVYEAASKLRWNLLIKGIFYAIYIHFQQQLCLDTLPTTTFEIFEKLLIPFLSFCEFDYYWSG